MSTGPQTVVIVGGGVSGLSAAHELAERGFAVTVYERRRYYGGKAASVTIGLSNPYTTGPKGLPGEHGFRFFPGWYRHLPHTLKRIPYKDRTVYDNLVSAETNLLAGYDRDPIRALLRLPNSLQELKTLTDFPVELGRLGLTAQDVRFFLGKMWEFLTASEDRRTQIFDNMTWAEFLEAPKRSQAYRDYLVEAATRSTVAAKPDEASAYTIAKVALQTIFDTLSPQNPPDRVLSGPTNEVWIEPWIDYLRGLGVTFVEDAELDAIDFGHGPAIKGLRFQCLRHQARMAEGRLALIEQLGERSDDDGAVPDEGAGPRDRPAALEALLDEIALRRLETGEESLSAAVRAEIARIAGPGLLEEARLRAVALITEANRQSAAEVTADYFIFALPVEQMAYYVNRSETLKSYDPSLRNIIKLSDHVDWMAGIQFFLTDTVNVTRGHIAALDSEWHLTAISQTQFWDDFSARDRGADDQSRRVKTILSVDVSAWDKRGRLHRKEAYNCDAQEIAEEVWHQLKETLNRPGKQPVLRDEMLLGHARGAPLPRLGYYLDDSIIDRFDRKKLAIYDRCRSVRFSAEELVKKREASGEAVEIPYRSGKRHMFNAEPLLINRTGSLALRPSAKTRIRNMFLAGDYVRTNTNLATMEGANEAARQAVNELLLAASSREAPCKIWPMSEPFDLIRAFDGALFRRGQQLKDSYRDIPIRLMAGTAESASRFAAKALGLLSERR